MSNTDNMRVLASSPRSSRMRVSSPEAGAGHWNGPFPIPRSPSISLQMTGVCHDDLDSPFGPASLRIDAELETAKIAASLTAYLAHSKRRGVVVALSGGIDSSTVAALCVAALGKDRVFGLHMPERESSSETIMLSRLLADSLGIDSALEEISPILEAAGCYQRRDDAIRKVCPDYGPGYKSKIVLPSVIDSDSFRLYSVVVMAPDGTQTKHRLTPDSYLGIVAATNFKQRVRKMLEYYHADRLNYVVAGTPNRSGVRPGFLREARRRVCGREADRPPLQVTGVRTGRIPGRPGGDPVPSPDDGHVLPAAVAGGILLLAAVRSHGPVPVRQEQQRPRRGHRGRDRPDRRAGETASSAISTRSARRRSTCISVRNWPPTSRRSPIYSVH